MNIIDTRHNPANEIAKYPFFDDLEHVEGKDPKTVRQYVAALHEFEVATRFRCFTGYNKESAKVFKHHLDNKKNKQTGEHISESLYVHYLAHVKRFFEWLLANDKNYKKLKKKDIDYLNAQTNRKNKAKAAGHRESHDVSDLLATIRNMPDKTIIERRNKAMFSLCLLTAPRISALQTAQIKSIIYMKDYDAWAFLQNPKDQNTKFSKKITAFFVGNCQDIIDNVLNWLEFLENEGFEAKDAFFPKCKTSFDAAGKPIYTLTKNPIKSQTIIRKALAEACANNNLPYHTPHTFRHSIAREAKKQDNSTELLIALAQNFGEKTGMATLVASYAGDYLDEQARLMKSIALK